jgi:hypothetical protein
MISYNDIYEASKKNSLVLFESPLSAERQFLRASCEIATKLQEFESD